MQKKQFEELRQRALPCSKKIPVQLVNKTWLNLIGCDHLDGIERGKKKETERNNANKISGLKLKCSTRTINPRHHP
jgi:hypothetical protein